MEEKEIEEIKEEIKLFIEEAKEKGFSEKDIIFFLKENTVYKSQNEELKKIFHDFKSNHKIDIKTLIDLKYDHKEVFDSLFQKETKKLELNDDESKKIGVSEKSKKLLEKVNELTEKIGQEKNPLKRHLLSFKIRMLLSKIRREIELNNIKTNYIQKRKEEKRVKESSEENVYTILEELLGEKEELKRDLILYSEYDPESEDYILGEYVTEDSPREDFYDEPREDNNQEEGSSRDSDIGSDAEIIKEMRQKRDRLNQIKDDIRQLSKELIDIKYDYDQKIDIINKEEKRMIVINKYNFFARIGNFFKDIKNQFIAVMDNRKQQKENAKIQKELESEIEARYQKEMLELKQKYQKAKEGLKTTDNSTRMNPFIKELKEMANGIEPSNNTSEHIQDNQPEHTTDNSPDISQVIIKDSSFERLEDNVASKTEEFMNVQGQQDDDRHEI